MTGPPAGRTTTTGDGGHDGTGDARDAAVASRRELAAGIRALASATVLGAGDDKAVAFATELVGRALAALQPVRRASRYEGTAGLAVGAPANDVIWDTHAAFGASNPLAPPVVVEEWPGRLVGTVRFGAAWEGGPGSVYGGFIAAAFDGLLGRTVLSAGHLAVTRVLEVRFRRPTPLHTELRVEATVGARSGRDIQVTGAMWHGTDLTCEAAATFTSVDAARYRC